MMEPRSSQSAPSPAGKPCRNRRTGSPGARAALALRRDQEGSTLVEFAMVAPILLMLIIGTMEVAQALHANSTLSRAMRDGARYAMVHGAASDNPATDQDIEDAVKASAYLLDPNNITVVVSYNPNANPGSKVIVQGSYIHQFGMPYLGHYPLNLTARAESTIFN